MVHNLLVVALLATASPLFAAQAVLENGDQITGAFESATGAAAVIVTSYAGPVSVELARVVRLVVDGDVWLTLQGDAPVHGTRLEFSDSRAVLTLDDGRSFTGSLAQIEAITTQEPASPGDDVAEPGVASVQADEQSWLGSVTFALAAVRGNTNQNNWRLAARGDKPEERNNYGVEGSAEYTTADGTAPRRRLSGLFDYRRSTDGRLYYTCFTSVDHDSGQQLDYRLGLGAAAGYKLTESSSTLFGIEVGVARTGEKYTGQAYQGNWDLTTAVGIDRPVTQNTSVSGKATLFSNPADIGDYRVVADLTILRKLRAPFSLTFSILDEYVNRPQPGILPNDTRIQMGLGYTFD